MKNETDKCTTENGPSGSTPPDCSVLSESAQKAAAWLLSDEAGTLSFGVARKRVIEKFGSETDTELQNWFYSQNALAHRSAGANTTKKDKL